MRVVTPISWNRKSSKKGKEYYATGVKRAPGVIGEKKLVAYDAVSATPRWSYALLGDGESWAGAMSTAGGLIFFGNDSEEFEAVDARSGKSLWKLTSGRLCMLLP